MGSYAGRTATCYTLAFLSLLHIGVCQTLAATHTIDILVVYTERAETDIASNSRFDDIDDYINERILETNDVFRRSNLDGLVNFNVRDTVRTDYNDALLVDGLGPALADLQQNRIEDQNGNKVHDLRDQTGADIVILVVDGLSGAKNGLAPALNNLDGNPNNAFAVINTDEAETLSEVYTWAHEIGHLLGATHVFKEDGVTPSNDGVTPSARAYVEPNQTWATVMVDTPDCPDCRVEPFFSDPTKRNCTNDDTGNACSAGDPTDLGARGVEPNPNATPSIQGNDVVEEFKKTIPKVAAYRDRPPAPAKVACWVDPYYNQYLVSFGPGLGGGPITNYTLQRYSGGWIHHLTSWGSGGECITWSQCDIRFRVRASGTGGNGPWCYMTVVCTGGGGIPRVAPVEPMASPVEVESQPIVDVLLGN